ncbi:MAG: signal peptidase I [bacterium]|nr:signal peptidase I [bacterium]
MDSELANDKKPPKRWTRLKRPAILNNEWVSIALFIAGVTVVYFFIQGFLIRTYLVDGQSMETTLQNGDRLIIDKIPRSLARLTGHAYVPHRGDIIIFNQSGIGFGSNVEKQLIKRVIGLPGERVVVKDGSLSIYNQAHPGGYEPDKTGLYHIDASSTAGNVDITLSSGEIFVCGDNRANSEDSRYFGPVNVERIIGKLSLRILPLSEAQRF